MADYIYLLQNRLTPAQRRALDAVQDAARAHGATVFLVGGAVRDLSSGTPVRDLDFAVQGEIAPLLDDLRSSGAVNSGENTAFSSVYLTFSGGVRAELGPTLTVSYPKPGQPETQTAAILDDLRRRDFTANAMAISLNEGSYGLLLDPLNGIADMENREIRLVSNYGFIEQPALLLRAARLSERLGWTLEERTQGRYATAKEENYIAALSDQERGYELEEVFHEEDPLAAMAHLSDEGWRDTLFPAWTDAKADREGLDRLRDLMGQMEQMGIHTDPSPVFFPLLTAKLPEKDVAALKASFARPGFVAQIDGLEARSKDLATQMTSKAAAAASDTWKLLFAAEPEIVLWLAYSSRSSAVQAKFRAFLNEWPQMRQRIPYAQMQEMRITPDLPGYEQLLDDLFFALIDGKLATTEATRAFLEPFSPPAPAPLASPRRRPAKAVRSRSRKAAEPIAAAAPDDTETETSTAAEPAAPAADSAISVSSETKTSAGVKSAAVKTPAPSTKVAGAKSPAKAASAGIKLPSGSQVPATISSEAGEHKAAGKKAVAPTPAPVPAPVPAAPKGLSTKQAAPITVKETVKTAAKPGKSLAQPAPIAATPAVKLAATAKNTVLPGKAVKTASSNALATKPSAKIEDAKPATKVPAKAAAKATTKSVGREPLPTASASRGTAPAKTSAKKSAASAPPPAKAAGRASAPKKAAAKGKKGR